MTEAAASAVTAWLKRRIVDPRKRAQVRRTYRSARAPWLFVVRWLRLRSLWQSRPVHPHFGSTYGTPVDRGYIEAFLQAHRADIHGRVLEIGDARYTSLFGGTQVQRSDVLHRSAGNPLATIVGDLANAPEIPSGQFDCLIVAQTLQYIYDYRSAIQTMHRILKPDGVLLLTMPGIAHQSPAAEREAWGDYWRWTSMAAARVFAETFGPQNVAVEGRGNVLAAVALLHGVVQEELRPSDLEFDDPEYELSIGVRAVKRVGGL